MGTSGVRPTMGNSDGGALAWRARADPDATCFSTQPWDSADGHDAALFLRDVNFIIVGEGSAAERLCERRVRDGGRLVWLRTCEAPKAVIKNNVFRFRPPSVRSTLH